MQEGCGALRCASNTHEAANHCHGNLRLAVVMRLPCSALTAVSWQCREERLTDPPADTAHHMGPGQGCDLRCVTAFNRLPLYQSPTAAMPASSTASKSVWPWITAPFDLGLRSDNFCETPKHWPLLQVAAGPLLLEFC